MAVAFFPGQTITRGDLDVFLQNVHGNPTNAAAITYALYYVDPGPPEVEVLVGDPARTPVNPQVGEYYASLMVPGGATPGTYRIRWTFKEFATSPSQMVVQEFAVVASSSLIAPGYSAAQQAMMDKLRMHLRDQCIGGEEEVELDVNGEKMVVRMDELWEILKGESQCE
ncbi:MAG: hypothetical protein WC824_15025 [Bacteroidota bacterium]|jgi:hypothetical protein